MTAVNQVGNDLTGSTGSGTFVGANTPTLITPVLGAASATSISFGGTALSNYVEGTFTPTLVSSGGGTPTYAFQAGTYTRIGNRVLFDLLIVLSGLPSAGNLTIENFPIACLQYASVTIAPGNLQATAVTQIVGYFNAATTVLNLFKYAAGAAGTLTTADLTTSSQFVINGQYSV